MSIKASAPERQLCEENFLLAETKPEIHAYNVKQELKLAKNGARYDCLTRRRAKASNAPRATSLVSSIAPLG